MLDAFNRSIFSRVVAFMVAELLVLSPPLNALAAAMASRPEPRARASADVTTAAKPPKPIAEEAEERQEKRGFSPENGDATSVAAVALARRLDHSAASPWALFDGDARTAVTSENGEPVRIEVTFAEPTWVEYVTGYGHTRGTLSVRVGAPGQEQALVGLEQVSLTAAGAFGPLHATQPVLVTRAVIEWVAGEDAGLAELAFWGVRNPVALPPESQWSDRITASGFPGALSFTSPKQTARVGEVGDHAGQTFELDVATDPSTFSHAFLTYELEGIAHWTGVPRAINGHAPRATISEPAADANGRAGLQVEELNPSWLKRGHNQVTFGLPNSSVAKGPVSSYRISNVRVVAVPHGAAYAAIAPAALSSEKPGVNARAEFGTPALPHSIGFLLDQPSKGRLIARTSGAKPVTIPFAKLAPGWHRWDVAGALSASDNVRFAVAGATKRALRDVRVYGAALPASEHELRIAYPLHGECSDGQGYVRGFVSGAAAVAPELTVDGQAVEVAEDGSFEFRTPQKKTAGEWAVDVHALLANGAELNRRVAFQACTSERALASTGGATPDVGAPYGEWVTPEAPKTLHYAGATLEIPAGAVTQPVRITIRPLGAEQASPPGRGLVNVDPGNGSFRFGPAGLRFKKAVKLTLPYDRSELPAAATLRSISGMYFDAPIGLWRAVRKISDANGGVVVSEIEHFTEFMNATLPAPDAPGVKNSAPDEMQGIELGNPSAGVATIQPPTANPNRGANLNYPLQLPPGRNGLAAQLALTYSSQAKNGWMGLGWNVNVSSIEHDTRFGVPDYDGTKIAAAHPDSLAGSIRYLLDGSALSSAGAAAGGTRFQRRVEGSYERILKLTTVGDDASYWEVTDKNGLKSVYGKTANARLADPNQPSHVFKWGLERVEDRFGNVVLVKYLQDTQVMSGVSMPQMYPKKICYGAIASETAEDCQGTYNVVFVLDAPNTRADRIIDARPGFPVKIARRLQRINVLNETNPIRSYDFRYKTGAFQKTLLDELGLLGTTGAELYKHHFEYEGASTNDAFAEAVTWGDAKAGTGLQTQGQLSRTKGWSAGGGGGIGLNFGFLSVGVSVGGSTGESRVRATPLEVSGDGVLDFLNGGNGSIGILPRATAGDHLLSKLVTPISEDSLGMSHTGGWTAGASLSILQGVAGIGGSIAHNESEDKHLLTDLNGDGFVDQVWVDDGTIKYLPGTKNGFGSVVTFGDFDDSVVSFANSDRQQNQRNAFFLVDPIARWRAPLTGPIAIGGAIHKQLQGGDGVTVSIYKNDSVIWTSAIGASPGADCVPSTANTCNASTPLTTSITAGENLYFRVSSTDDTRKDLVAWSPEVTYTSPPAGHANDREPEGAFVYRASLGDDFRVVGLPKRPWTPNAPGVVQVYGASMKQTTSDDVELNVYYVASSNPNNPQKIGHAVLAANYSGPYEIVAADVTVDRGDLLFFEVKSDAPVDPERLGWDPHVRYSHYSRPDPDTNAYVDGDITGCEASAADPQTFICHMENDPTPDDPVRMELIVQQAEVNFASFQWEATNDPTASVAAGSVSAGTLARATAVGGRLCALIQGVNKMYSKACIEAGHAGSVALPAPSGITAGEPLYFTITSTASLATPLSGYSWNPSNNGGTPPINVRALDARFADTASPLPNHDMMSGGYHNWSFGDYRADLPFDEVELQKQRVEAQKTNAAFFFASGTRLAGPATARQPEFDSMRGQNVYVGRGLFSPGRSKGGTGLAGTNGGIDALRLSDTWSYGLNASVLAISVAAGAADTTGEVDLVDMNGDNFPDLVTRDGVLFNTGANGFASQKTPYNFDEFRKVDQSSARLSVNVDLSGGDEKKQAVPNTDTKGHTRAMLSASFSAGLEYAVSSDKVELIDLNQDGLPDRVELDPKSGATAVRLNTGYGLTPPIQWTVPGFDNFGTMGIADDVAAAVGNVVGKTTGSHSVRYEDTGSLSAGVAVGGGASIGLFGGSAHVGAGYVYSLNRSAVEFMDVNNDGLLDHVGRHPGEPFLRVKLNYGDYFGSEEHWPLPAWPASVDGAFTNLGDHILEAVGGGNPETLGFTNSRDYSVTFDVEVCYFFVCGSAYGFYHDTAGGSAVTWKDVNGDGFVDQVAKVDGDSAVYVKLNKLGKANLLKSVTQPFGGGFELVYDRYGNELSDDTTRAVDLPSNTYALVEVRANDGRGQTLAQQFDYTAPLSGGGRQQTGKYDRVEREDYGSSNVTLTRGAKSAGTGDGSQVESQYHNQDYYRHGLLTRTLEREVKADGSVRPFTEQTFEYEDPTATTKQTKPDPLVGSFFPALNRSTTAWYEGQATPGKTTEETRTWNFVHGGIASLSIAADDGAADDLYYEVSYDARGLTFAGAGDLYLVKPSRVTARQGGATGAILRDRRATYDGTTGALATYSAQVTGGAIPGGSGNYADAASTLTITRDAVGNVQTITDANGYVLTYGYDPTGIYATSTTDSFGYVSTSTPNYLFGGVSTTTDLNGQSVRYEYDTFGRLITVWGPNDFVADATAQQSIVPTLRAAYGLQPGASGAPFWAKFGHKDIVRNASTTTAVDHDYVETITFIDGFGRVIQTKKDVEKDFGTETRVGFMVSGHQQFDERGRLKSRGQPVFSSDPAAMLLDVNATFPVASEKATSWTYDVLGRVTDVRTPADTTDVGSAFLDTTTSYGFGTDASGVARFRVTTTDPRGVETVQHRDVMQRTLEVIERANAVGGSPILTKYKYSPISDLLEVDDVNGNASVATYDTAGRMVSLKNPDIGLTQWKYDLVGNVREKQTERLRALNQSIVYEYDFNRLRKVKYPTSTARVYTYGDASKQGDANGNVAGRLMSETSEAGTRSFLYDRYGNTTLLDVTYNRLREPSRGPYRYQVLHRYDSFGRLLRVTYPDMRDPNDPDQMALGDVNREVLTYTYDAGGSLQAVFGLNTQVNSQHPDEVANTIYLTHQGYDEFGEKAHLIAGNFIETNYVYKDRTHRLWQVNSTERDPALRRQNRSARPFQQLNYTYDLVGNITELRNDAPFDQSMNGSVLVGNLKHSYTYDSLDRLTAASGLIQETKDSRFRYVEKFSYNDIHNITKKTNESYRQVPDGSGGFRDDHPIHDQTYDADYTYAGPRPHAVTRMAEQLPAESPRFNRDFTYDASGNETKSVWRSSDVREVKWNEEDLPSSIAFNSQVRMQNLYDGSGQRAVSLHLVSALEETAYISQDLTIRDGKYLTKHVYAGESQLASKMDSAWLNYPPTIYFHTDHLSSTQYASIDDQTLVQHDEYFPSGELWQNETDSRYELARRYQWTGKELDIGTNLYYFGARYYDPHMSQWLSPDPILNRYMGGEPVFGVFAPMNLSLYSYGHLNPILMRDLNGMWSWKSFAVGAAKGFATGVVIGVAVGAIVASAGTAGPVIAVAVAAYGGYQLGQGVGQLVTGRDANGNKMSDEQYSELAGNLVGGTVGGAVGGAAGGRLGARFSAPKGVPPEANLAPPEEAPTACTGSQCGGGGTCFTAGTLVATASGMVPIETLSVGDRVLSPDGRDDTTVTPEWQVVELEMPNPSAIEDTVRIQLLRPPAWLARNSVELGAVIPLSFEEVQLQGDALVTDIRPAPRLTSGEGRVVLGTVTHTNNHLVRLHLNGDQEIVEPTAPHRFYSTDRQEWVPAEKIKEGEHIRTATGTVTVSRVERLPAPERVYNLEVESEHQFYVSSLRVLTHNTCGETGNGNGISYKLKKPPGVSDEAWQAKMDKLNEGAARGDARVVHKPTRTGAAQRQARGQGMIKPGEHADHGLDLQFGGADDVGNITSTPARVNTSVGAQGRGRLAYPDGTPIKEFVSE